MATSHVDPPALDHLDLPILGMTCTSCAARIERGLNGLDGVEATVNYVTEKASVDFDPGVDDPATGLPRRRLSRPRRSTTVAPRWGGPDIVAGRRAEHRRRPLTRPASTRVGIRHGGTPDCR
jgi:cation transport ATPase